MRKIYIAIFILTVSCGFLISQTPVLVKDIYVGLNNSNTDLVGLPILNGIVFTASDGTDGPELWFSDGTTSGTNKLKDLNPGSSGSYPANYYAYGTKILFIAQNGFGQELWLTDGTASGTNMIKDINVGGSSFPAQLNPLGTKVIFTAVTQTENRELWITDGTSTGTNLVKDIWPGVGNSNVSQLTNSGLGYYYFVANDGVSGEELWKSDGTNVGTNLVKDILPGTGFSNITIIKMSGGLLYFLASDGVNGKELWRSDGTTVGTYMLKDINVGVANTSVLRSASYNNRLIFETSDPVNGNELWESDGTIAGTFVNNISTGTLSTIFPTNLYEYSNDLYFFTRKIGVGSGNDTAMFYKVSNSLSNLTLVKKYPNITLGTAAFSFIQTNNTKFVGVGHSITATSSGNLFFVSDATPSGSNFVTNKAISLNDAPETIPFYNNNWIFPVNPGLTPNNFELNNIDYSSGVVSLIKNINPTTNFNGTVGNSWNYRTYFFNNNYIFLANDGNTGVELWKTDGTNSGTTLLLDIYPGTSNGPVSYNGEFKAIVTPNNMFFYASNGTTGRELWAFGLTTGLTTNMEDVFQNISLYPNPTNLNISFTLNQDFIRDKNISYKIYNPIGQVCESGELKTNSINVSSLAEGCYFVEISSGNFNKVMKFIKN